MLIPIDLAISQSGVQSDLRYDNSYEMEQEIIPCHVHITVPLNDKSRLMNFEKLHA
jgi:hypothetical protein